MNKFKSNWKWSFDRFLEEEVWTKIPKEIATPHFFFFLGFIVATFFWLIIL